MYTNMDEKHRPQLHFSPKENWMNDPNGLVFFNGEYHLFFQHHPFSATWGPMHWGHAVSKDLIHWEQLPIALHPDHNGAIFSGSIVVDWNDTSGFFGGKPGLVAIYTSADEYPGTDRPRQRQSLAYSSDSGRTWTVYGGNPVLTDENIIDYRDPKVFWHSETERWVMVLATGQTITLYTSPDLKEWQFASEFGSGQGCHDGVWECPDLFPLPVGGNDDAIKWVMLVSIGDNPQFDEGSRTQYFIGSFDGKAFVNEMAEGETRWLDYGRDNYAGVSWSDIPAEDGRRIYIGWMSNWRYANIVPTEGWRSAMTLPRELKLIADGESIQLIQQPVEELADLHLTKTAAENIHLGESQEESFDLPSALAEIQISFEGGGTEAFGIAFENSLDEQLAIHCEPDKGELEVDRTHAGDNSFSDSFAAIQKAPLEWMEESVHLQIILDASSVEVFANGGRAAITSLVFPGEPYKKVSIFSKKGSVTATIFEITELSSIWTACLTEGGQK
ncbi:glycoside hydrolase family 32 protein [Bacillus infantis]|uniref:glycoside hydrolase family 32 protein n=1 Tax=Bacillus infantis TaxID=324767 RepID=UPI002005EA05|nr:glycoside hydrolase family 32 protein [Bacillus infantis]